MVLIRRAKEEDIPQLWECCRKGHIHTDNFGLGIEPDFPSLEAYLKSIMSQDRTIVLVVELEGKVLGTMASVIVPWFSNHSVLTAWEVWWFVDESIRNWGAGEHLMDTMTEWAKDHGAKFLLCGFPTSNPYGESLTRHFERSGFKEYSRIFFREA